MNSYLKDTEFAAKGLFELALSGDAELKRLSQGLKSANAGFAMNYLDSSSMDSNDDLESDEDSSEDQLDAAYAAALQFHQHATALQVDIARLEKELLDKDIALQTLAGAILQIAKQGISIVHGGLKSAPVVRVLAPSPLALPTVIWEGRNQAMHYERMIFIRLSGRVFTSSIPISGHVLTLPPIQPAVALAKYSGSLAGRTTSRI